MNTLRERHDVVNTRHYSPTTTNNAQGDGLTPSTTKPADGEKVYNQVNIQMLYDNLREQIFGNLGESEVFSFFLFFIYLSLKNIEKND